MSHATQPATEAEDAAYYREVLHTLIAQGSALATRIHENATAATPTDENRPNADPTVAFDRVARAVRRCIALARHIAANPAEPAQDPAKQAATRARLIRGVEDAIHRQRRNDDHDPLYAELAERLEDPALDLHLATRSVDDIINEIARDLGVAIQPRSFVWKRRTPADIRALYHRAGLHPVPQAPRKGAPQATTPKPPLPS